MKKLFDIETDKIVTGAYLFCADKIRYTPALKKWDSPLSSLVNGYGMFYGCLALSSFTSNLSSLRNG